jgi:hypothetical protein
MYAFLDMHIMHACVYVCMRARIRLCVCIRLCVGVRMFVRVEACE